MKNNYNFVTCLDKHICYLYYYKFGLLYDNNNILKGKKHCFIHNVTVMLIIKGNQKGNIKCYARERANTKQPF